MSVLISVIDDDASFRRALVSLLKSLGYDVDSFGTAEEFLGSGRIGETDCLISDVQMPGMSGLDLQAKLNADGHELPMIFVAASPGAKAREQAIASGALAFLGKPFPEERLITILNHALSGPADSREPGR
ncbi:MAG TPA: response regulator [Steroidobacteraceae bacterium]|nr:response regulator [Steroidobacteraceae bacterium]